MHTLGSYTGPTDLIPPTWDSSMIFGSIGGFLSDPAIVVALSLCIALWGFTLVSAIFKRIIGSEDYYDGDWKDMEFAKKNRWQKKKILAQLDASDAAYKQMWRDDKRQRRGGGATKSRPKHKGRF